MCSAPRPEQPVPRLLLQHAARIATLPPPQPPIQRRKPCLDILATSTLRMGDLHTTPLSLHTPYSTVISASNGTRHGKRELEHGKDKLAGVRDTGLHCALLKHSMPSSQAPLLVHWSLL